MRIVPVAVLTCSILLPSLAGADCKSSYLPLVAGNTWTFTQADGTNGHTTRVAKVEGDTFVLEMITAGDATSSAKAPANTSTSVVGACLNDGIRVNIETSGASASGGHAKMETVSEEGYGFPKDAGVKVGAQWSESRVMKMVMQGGKDGKTTGMTMTMKTSHKIVGKESVTVPAGTFDAFKIVSESETTSELSALRKGPPPKTIQTMWVVKGVGMVKQEMTLMMGGPGGPGGLAGGSSVLKSYKVK